MISSTDENKLISDPSGSDTFTKRRRRRRKRKRNNGNKKQQQHLQIFIQGFDEAPVSTGNKEKQAHEGQHQEMVSMGNDSRVTKNNSVLSKLLRRARYFDPPEERSYACRNCGEDGHREGTCTAQKPRRPCFGCGNLDHSWRRCKLRRNCFSCKGQGHVAKYCPYKNQGNNPVPDICLRCGDTGHDMFSCCNDYCPRDIQEIQCYSCKSFGHLCCADSLYASPISDSCYICGQSGHWGSRCMKTCEDKRGFSSRLRTTSAEEIVLQENS
ncbi:hypothetical protein TIFTF001_001136 [Ficus carica]|uniref:CCHC-type domain-containing protein n=1 Tax=Ficus carica TaxID=3494 RepID=A0AA87YYK6_FICCA|nr:hypothetical protein TIFTF001_001136 [Ficus carica]